MRLSLIVALAALLVVIAWFATNHDAARLHNAPERLTQPLAHSETRGSGLSPVEEMTGRVSVWDEAIEINPADYPPEPPDAGLSTAIEELEPELRGFEVSGVLVLPSDWNDAVPEVLLCPVGGTDRLVVPTQRLADADDGTRRWRGRVQGAGTYWIGTTQPAYCIEIAVTGDLADVRLVLPPPIEVECLVLDALTGTPIENARVSYRPLDIPSSKRIARAEKIDEVAGLYRWKCFPAKGTLSCYARDFDRIERVVQASELDPSARLRVELLRQTRIVVKVRDEATGEVLQLPHPLGRESAVVFERDGQIMNNPRQITGGSYVVRISEPPTGFQPSFPKRVTVRDHETVEVVFDLKRR